MPQLLQALIPMAIFILVFYVLIIRPQKKQEREVTDMRASVKVGDDVVTIGGIMGNVTRVTDDEISIEVGASKVKLNLKKWSLRDVVSVVRNDTNEKIEVK